MRTSSKKISLTDLVERLAARDPGQVERHDGDAAPLEAVARVDGAEERRHVGDRPVRHPGRLLTADHPGVAVLARHAVRLDRRIVKMLLGDGERVAAVVRLGDRPAPDLLVVLSAEALDQGRSPRHLREHAGEPGDAQADREPRVATAHLLGDEQPHSGRLGRIHLGADRVQRVETELPLLLEDLPQHGVGGDDLPRIGKLIELPAGGEHHLVRELARGVPDLLHLIGEPDLDLEASHGSVLPVSSQPNSRTGRRV
jgi:hypothetical protein